MSINEIRDFIFENYYIQNWIFEGKQLYLKKKFLLLANKLIEKLSDPGNAKEHYQSFIRKKNPKISETIRNNYLSIKNV